MTSQTGDTRTSGTAAVPSVFERTTTTWGRLTMTAGMLVSLAGPAYLLFVAGYWPGLTPILTGFAAVAAVFAVYWILEPVTYYPMLGGAGLYQAFLIGNISNKLLPAAVSAQSVLKLQAGTRRAEVASVAAICGAALMHVVTLALLVGVAGTWLVSALPASITATFDYVLPAVLGPVLVQLLWKQPQWRAAVPALVVAAVMVLLVAPHVPVLTHIGMIPTVLLGVTAAVLLRRRR
ncbi:hypothetical protein [Saccharomonospora iraqiensis]|uniref:hypothetical protein n=1 Tax=Saccharomonospora iraqiensis TaxID=52698 RepID=UPI000410484D|nr:hypothetical protein [Saccharomonospora iraqiensis]